MRRPVTEDATVERLLTMERDDSVHSEEAEEDDPLSANYKPFQYTKEELYTNLTLNRKLQLVIVSILVIIFAVGMAYAIDVRGERNHYRRLGKRDGGLCSSSSTSRGGTSPMTFL